MSGLPKNGSGVFLASMMLLSAVLCGAVGCQTNSMMTVPWNQATRVPPPNAPTNLPTAPYANPVSQPGATLPSGAAAPKSVGAYSSNPLTDAVAAAQNDLRMATDSARSAIEKSANSVNQTVSQAGARIDRVGSGVVQATGIIESSLMDPIPLPQGAIGAPESASPSGANPGVGGTLGGAATEDPNAQWRKPVVR